MTDLDFRALFAQEGNERLDAMVQLLLELEAGNAADDAVDALFREAHSLKGGAAMVQLDELADVAHAVEDLLHDAREAGTLATGLVQPLLDAADAMRTVLAGGSVDRVAVLAALAEPTAPAPPPTATSDRTAATPAAERRAIRVAPEKVDKLLDLVGESILHRRRLEHALAQNGSVAGDSRRLVDELDLGERLLDDLKDTAVGMRTLPLSAVTAPLPRALRDAAQSAGKHAELTIVGADAELDRAILESLADPLAHMIRNAVAHGIEAPAERQAAGKDPVGRVELRAVQHGGWVEVVVADDGRGVAPAVVAEAQRTGSSVTDILTRAGFSTAEGVSGLAGRGVGLDAVRAHVESFGGTLEVRSEEGAGTEIALVLPLALALLDVLLVERAGQVFCIPLSHVEEAVVVDAPLRLDGQQRVEVRGRTLPVVDLADALAAEAPALADAPPAVIVTAAARRAAISCDRLLGEQEVVVKSLGPLLRGVTGYLGAAILGDGRIALIVEPASLLKPVAAPMRRPSASAPQPIEAETAATARRLLVVEDSLTVRELQRSILEAAGYHVETARDGREGLTRLLDGDDFDLVLTDVEMPEMDGFELTEAIRCSDTHSSTPVVILTSLADDAFRLRGLEAGADAYMVKSSFGQRALLETVERLVG